jgi:ribosomal protein S27AE
MDDQEIRAQRETCSDCGGQLQEIRLIDRAHNNVHATMQYASLEAKMSRWSGTFPIEGQVLAFLCSRCGRIALYGATVPAE